MVTVDGNQDQIRKLATYLRHNPGALSADPEIVARDCGVDVDLVRRSFVQRRAATPQPFVEADLGPNALQRLRVKVRTVFNFFDRYLLVVVAVSLLLMIGVLALLPNGRGFGPADIFAICLIPLVAIFHFMLYFRRGHVRFAFLGALIVWLITSATIGITIMVTGREGANAIMGAIMAAVGLFFLCMLYGGVGAASALMGAYRVVRSEENAQRNRSRQDLIERMFQIEDQLAQQAGVTEEESWFRRFLGFARQHIWGITIGSGLTMGLVNQIITLILEIPKGDQMPSLPFLLASIVVTGLQFAIQTILAFVGGHPIRSLFVSVVYSLSIFAIGFLPFFSKSLEFAKEDPTRALMGYILVSFLSVLIGIFAGIGAQVEERSYRQKRLQQNDPQMLLAELIEIQRVLNPDTSTQYLMVVDAARSSVMKSNADPMQAEWSFREYQKFLARIVESQGGRIHSTAGDGAIAIFTSASSAFNAAREIQTKISEFNLNVSRLKDPFRLRIGIHCDTVQADLTDVQFAAVIDIAAHVEGASQIGGIAVTQPVADQLPEHRFAVLSDLVDGFVVSMALNPTLDPEDYV